MGLMKRHEPGSSFNGKPTEWHAIPVRYGKLCISEMTEAVEPELSRRSGKEM